MNHFLNGFSDELVKLGTALGALKGVGKFTMKHPLLSLGAGATIIGTGLAAREGYRRGRSGEKARYLAATVDPISGRARASRTAYVPHGKLFKKLKTPGVSKHYKEKAFKR